MLIIRDEQLEVFTNLLQTPFENRVMRRLRERFPRQTKALPGEKLREHVREQIARAKSYGLRSKRDICRYIDYTFVFSPDFDRSPKTSWARAILCARKLSGAEKMQRIDDYYTYQLKGKA